MAYTTINDPTDYFNTVLYTGNGGTNAITGVGFQPDLVWLKERSSTSNHQLGDSVRGATKYIQPNVEDGESTDSNRFSSFDSDGFTQGANNGVNESGQTYVAWNWLASNTTASNTDGSITSTVSANTTSGFSIVSYTGTGTSGTDTFGHGLGVTPSMVIFKNRTDGSNAKWTTYHKSLTNGANSYLELNQANAESNLSLSPPLFGTPSSTTMGAGHFNSTNGDGDSIIAYCFAEKKGFSKFGSYTGNGSSDGSFVFCGFKPAFVLMKSSSNVVNWKMHDNKRDSFNDGSGASINANDNSSEDDNTAYDIDFLSNGFKQRNNNSNMNSSGYTYIYMAFAENPFTTSTGTPTTAR